MPNLIKVQYDDTTQARWAREFRRELKRSGHNIGGRNVAAISFTNPNVQGVPNFRDLITLPSEPPAQGKAFASHSEKVLLQAIRQQLQEDGAQIQWLYTERQPCGRAPGHANCTALLEQAMRRFGAKGTDTPVYFSFDYPTAEDLRSIIDGGLVTQEDAKEWCREVCLSCTKELIEAANAL